MIEFIGITKKFKSDFWKKYQTVLDDFSFKIEEGSLCGFLGANGAGKTTSIKLLLQFIFPNSGEIIFDKSLGCDFNQIRRNIGYFPERPFFYPYLSGREFCHYMASLMGIKSTEIDNQIKTWATLINIEHALDRKIRGYSKGMLQRLGFLVSILHNPKLIILDEPLSGLDPIGRKEFKDIMKKLHDNGTTIFFSSHILSDVEETCDHLVVLKDGKNFFQGKTVDLLSKNQDYQYEIGVRIESEEEGKKLFSTGRFKDGAYTFRCEKKDKNDIVKKALEHNLELLFLRSERPTLEEIIYDTRTE